MVKVIVLWVFITIAAGSLVAMLERTHQTYTPNEYRLVCDVQTKRAYVTFKAWSAHVPNADKFCENATDHMAPIVRLI